VADSGTQPVVGATGEQVRRLNPRIIDTDWLILRDLRAAIIARVSNIAREGATALDFGCGSKPYEAIFTAAGVSYIGADFDGRGDLPVNAAGRLQAQDQSADLVLSFQVLEHVRDLQTYFSEARRVLRQDGSLLLSTHGTWLFHPHPEDHRRWTRQGLCAEIAGYDFEVVDCVPLVGPLAWTTIIRLTCACYVLRRIPLVGFALGHLLALVMNMRAWIEDMITPYWVKNDNACVYLVLARPAARAVTGASR
jgi:SAM-dependent methyltransferase